MPDVIVDSDEPEELVELDHVLHEIEEERKSAMRWRIAFFVLGMMIVALLFMIRNNLAK